MTFMFTIPRSAVLALVLALLVGCSGPSAIRRTALRFDRGEAEAVYREYQAKVKESPDDSEALVIFARAAARTGRDAEAVEALDRADAMGGKHAKRASETRADLWLAIIEGARGALDNGEAASPAEHAAAATALERAERFDPDRAGNPAIRLLLSGADTPDAAQREWVDAALGRVDDDGDSVRWVVDALRLRAGRLGDIGRHDDAVAMMMRALELAPESNEVAYDLGVQYHRLGEAGGGADAFEKARAQFEAVVERLPDDAEARYNLALACYRLEDIDCVRNGLSELFGVRLQHRAAHTLAARIALADADTSRARGHITAARSLAGERVPVPTSALDVAAGPPAAKRFVLVGPPTAIYRYAERSGQTVEVWFDEPRRRVLAYGDRRELASLDLRPTDTRVSETDER